MFHKRLLCLLVLFSQLLTANEELIKKLTEAHGASGFEGSIRRIVAESLQGVLEGTDVDGLGNLIGHLQKPQEGAPRVLLMAHMDEVGFLVRRIDENGFIFFDSVGAWIDPVILEHKWVITTPKGQVFGVTGVESAHVIEEYPKVTTPSQKKMFLDIGVSSRAEAEALGVRPGLPITPFVSFENLNGMDRYMAKAFDDRIGLAAVITALKNLKEENLACDVIFAATVQEEVGSRGAQAVFEGTLPNIVINVEVGIARDFPVLYPNFLTNTPCIGKGPTIDVYDSGMIPNNRLVDYFIDVAHMNGIPFQFEPQSLGYFQDGCRLQTSGQGCAVINICIPTRYVHSSYGVVDRKDFDSLVKLLECAVKEMNSKVASFIQTY